MDELERRLRHDPAGEREPSETRLRQAIETEIEGRHRPLGAPVVRGRTAWAGLLVPAAILVVALAVGRGFVARTEPPGASPASDLLARVEEAGSIRIAVRADHPQFTREGTGIVGFDVDVARAMATDLGVQADIVALPAADIVGGSDGGWDLALPSVDLASVDAGRFAASAPYYSWPHLLLAPESSGLRRAADLAGRRVCAVEGDPGKAWLEGGAGAGLEPVVVPMASDDACFAALSSGDVDALE